jgi:hypothetical protein
MNKKILNYSYEAHRIMHGFYPNCDTQDNIKYNDYDIIICNRDNVQNEFDKIIKYTNSDTKFIIDIIQESGCLDNFIDFFDKLTRTHSNRLFYLFVDSEFNFNFSSNVISLRSYNLSLLCFFDNFCIHPHDSQLVIEKVFTQGDLNIYDKESGILCLNGSIRPQRIFLLLELIKRGFVTEKMNIADINNEFSFLFYNNESFDKSFFTKIIINLNKDNLISDDDLNYLIKYSDKLPLKLKNEDGSRQLYGFNRPYKKIINLVTENTAGWDGSDNTKYGTITFTEKAWKPFKTHQLPIFISLNGYVNRLKELGFDLFDDFLDHSYDNETDHKLRLEKAVTEVERISKLDCLEYYRNNYHRFINNYISIHKMKAKGYLELQKFILNNELI